MILLVPLDINGFLPARGVAEGDSLELLSISRARFGRRLRGRREQGPPDCKGRASRNVGVKADSGDRSVWQFDSSAKLAPRLLAAGVLPCADAHGVLQDRSR